MALLGNLEQFGILNVLQRVETFKKTGLLIMKRGEQWVELYFRDGQLMCIGPVRGKAALGNRLLYANVISSQALQTVTGVLGSDPAETRLALTLMDMRLVTHEALRAWATREAIDIIQILTTWPEGEIHFEDNHQPSPDRLLVALSVSSLLTYISPLPAPAARKENPPAPTFQPAPPVQSARPTPPVQPTPPAQQASPMPPVQPGRLMSPMQPTPPAQQASLMPPMQPGRLMPQMQSAPPVQPVKQQPQSAQPAPPAFIQKPPVQEYSPVKETSPVTGTLNAASLFDMSNLFAENTPTPDTPMVTFSPDSEAASAGGSMSSWGDDNKASTTLTPPVHIATPAPPRRIDTSFMHADMLLLPTDLSAMRQQSIMLQLTPDQWRVFTQVNGQNSLQMICQNLGMPPDLVCQVAGELIAMGIAIFSQPQQQVNELSPVSNEFLNAGFGNGYVTPGHSASNAQPWMSAMPTTTDTPRGLDLKETQSQWGNGGNGATFVPGQGWVLNPPPTYSQPQPQQGNNSYYTSNGMNGLFAPAGN